MPFFISLNKRRGYLFKKGSVRMKSFTMHILIVALLLITGAPLKAQTSSLTLQILSQGTNITVDSAKVELLDYNIKVISNRYGNAKITSLREGLYLVSIKHPNFESKTVPINIKPNEDVMQSVSLIPQLDEIVVTEKRVDQFLEDQGFNRRMKTGFGTYITREEVKKKGRLNMTDVLRGIPGVNLQRYESRLIATVNRSRSKSSNTPCALDVYVDGYNMGGNPPDLNLIAIPAEVAAVEVYKGPATLPAQFNRFNSCGAIIIWTKMTIKDEDS